jgi:ATP-dependent Clp protease protease subunit
MTIPGPQRWPHQPGPPQPPLPGVPAVAPDRAVLRPELAEQLLARRIVLVTGHLDHTAATAAAAQLMLLDGTGDEPVTVHLRCPDGDLDAAVMLAETIDVSSVPVHAVAGGILGGSAVAPYAAARHRAAHPHTAIQLREPRLQTSGTADQLVAQIAAHQHQLDYLYQHVADACDRPVAAVITDMQAGRLLTGSDALRYGLVHELLTRPTRP